MTKEHEASRTLVKSPPELWAECSDPGSLARHLGEFGEIKITRLEPESTVAWEGEHASGTVRIEASGWGTRVTLTAQTSTEAQPPPEEAAEDPPEGESPADVEPLTGEGESPTHDESPTKDESPAAQEGDDATVEETLADQDPVPVDDTVRARARWRRLTARMRGLFGPGVPDETEEPRLVSEPEPPSEPEPEPEPAPEAPSEPEAAPEPALELASASGSDEPAPSEPGLDAEAILASALESLGQAHHRPFSRA